MDRPAKSTEALERAPVICRKRRAITDPIESRFRLSLSGMRKIDHAEMVSARLPENDDIISVDSRLKHL